MDEVNITYTNFTSYQRGYFIAKLLARVSLRFASTIVTGGVK
jgi:hypothetical protein